MVKKYKNLQELLQENPAARRQYDALPQYVRDSIAERGNSVCCRRDLEGYTEKLLRGDD